MNINALTQIKNLANAYIVSGVLSDSTLAVRSLLETRGVKLSGNPDIYEVAASEFGVDDARAVSDFAALKALGDAKYFLLAMSRPTREAQNALLKVIEEAPGNSIFFFIVESAGHVLPTIRSRSIHVLGPVLASHADSKDAEVFLKSSFEARLSAVEKMTSYITKTQDRAPSRAFIGGLLVAARTAGYPSSALRDILDADGYIRLQGGSAKAVLSHLAVSLPRG